MIKLTSKLVISALICFSFLAHAELGQTMKQMKYALRDAIQATTVTDMKSAISDLSKWVDTAKTEKYEGDNQAAYDEGLTELSTALTTIQAQLDKDDLDGAKQSLKKVNALRKEYHQKTR